jgi:hypothetical protein
MNQTRNILDVLRNFIAKKPTTINTSSVQTHSDYSYFLLLTKSGGVFKITVEPIDLKDLDIDINSPQYSNSDK